MLGESGHLLPCKCIESHLMSCWRRLDSLEREFSLHLPAGLQWRPEHRPERHSWSLLAERKRTDWSLKERERVYQYSLWKCFTRLLHNPTSLFLLISYEETFVDQEQYSCCLLPHKIWWWFACKTFAFQRETVRSPQKCWLLTNSVPLRNVCSSPKYVVFVCKTFPFLREICEFFYFPK